MPLVGTHNVRNALAAIAVAAEAGLMSTSIAPSLRRFTGVKRRLEVVGTAAGVTVYDDFAHHSTAVAETLAGLRASSPGARIWAVFEPRSATSCRRVFQDDFGRAFAGADEVVFAPVFRSTLPERERLSIPDLVRGLQSEGKAAREATSIDQIVELIVDEHRPGDLVVLMSNGGFGGIHKQLLQALEQVDTRKSEVNERNLKSDRFQVSDFRFLRLRRRAGSAMEQHRTHDFRIVTAGDSAVVVEFEERIDAEVNAKVVAVAEAIEAERIGGVRDVVPTFRSVAIYFDPLRTVFDLLHERLERAAANARPEATIAREPIPIPVSYGGVRTGSRGGCAICRNDRRRGHHQACRTGVSRVHARFRTGVCIHGNRRSANQPTPPFDPASKSPCGLGWHRGRPDRDLSL